VNHKTTYEDLGDEVLLDKYRTCALLGIKPKTLESWRRAASGPAYIRISPTCVRYRRRDVLEWIEARRCPG